MKLLPIILFSILSSYTLGANYIGTFRPQLWGDGLFIIPLNATTHGAVPSCVSRTQLRLRSDPHGVGQDFIPDEGIFNRMYSMILATYMSGKRLELKGTGTCSVHGDEIIYVVQPLE